MGSKVRPRTFGCVAMGSALLFIVRSRLLIYSTGSGVNRVQVFCLDLVRGCFVLSRQKKLQAVELSHRTQAAVQIVSNLPAPSNGGPDLSL